jgi:hypothetical protein
MHAELAGVARHINDIRGYPAPLIRPVHVYIEPGSYRCTTIDGAGVASTQVPSVEVSLGWAPHTRGERFINCDMRIIVCGGGGERWRVGKGGGKGKSGGGSVCGSGRGCKCECWCVGPRGSESYCGGKGKCGSGRARPCCGCDGLGCESHADLLIQRRSAPYQYDAK